MSGLIDPTQAILTRALDGLTHRQQLISSNLTNIDTPGYRPQAIDFESALKEQAQAVANATGDISASAPIRPSADFGLRTTDPRHFASAGGGSVGSAGAEGFDGTIRNDGNKVDIESEMTALSETQIKYSAVSRLMNSKFSQLLTVIGGR